jgi:demethylmenaquinone methyltransferase/2-methoxy-6-polyprenyl-1,4-benzoquinol methylase
MTHYDHDSVVPYATAGGTKKEQVAGMFNRIAFRYDLLNRLLSAGIDVHWRKKALQQLLPIKPVILLDVATGTADVALLAQKMLGPQKIIGIDISEGMLEIGRHKVHKAGLERCIELAKGDSEAINYPADTFDAVTVAFGVRNFENLEKGLQEILRVLKPGGRLVVLEFSRPRAWLFRKFYDLYREAIAPNAGALFSRNKEAYIYLNKSVTLFPEGPEFIKILQKTGYTSTTFKRLSFGICTIYCGTK